MEMQEWLERTTAADIMVRDIVTLKRNESLAVAAEVLLREQVTGVPVVDTDGTCVGVLSVVDVISADQTVAKEVQKVVESNLFHSNLALPASIYRNRLAEVRDKITPAAEQPVEHFMTTDLVSVGEATPLKTIIQHMVDAHIHRILVLDRDRRLQGIVSTVDVLAGLLRAGHR
jgi:predicted transcriptional regulator